MTRRIRRIAGLTALVLFAWPAAQTWAQEVDPGVLAAAQLFNDYRIVPEVTYLTAEGHANNLDLYLPRNSAGPTPVVLYFHGGWWVRGSRQASALAVQPYLRMGWAAVNVSYRLGNVSLAPGAVEDALCALRWVIRNAESYNLDPSRIVATGHSAGGQLSLMLAMLPEDSGLDARCAGNEPLRVAGAINWYGVTDVADHLQGPNLQPPVVEWFGSMPDRFEVAARVSPLTYARAGLPPILSIHGDADRAVPHAHATRLDDALRAAGSPHDLHTVPGGGHGGFTPAQTAEIFAKIQAFLRAVEAGEGQ
jgi:acetyl esterase/lipase